MLNNNDGKNKQLGMPYGTACHRLRKNVLMFLLQKSHQDICFRCGKKIVKAQDLSLDHKLPWFGASNDLFWDVENIAFSHTLCNSKAGRKVGGTYRKIVSPDGQSWCSACQKHRPRTEFAQNTGINNRNGLSTECHDCRRKRYRNNQE